MAKVVQGMTVRFNGVTGLAVSPRERIGYGSYIDPSSKDQANIVAVAEAIGYGLVIGRICLEKQLVRMLIGRGNSEIDMRTFTHEFEARDVAEIFNDLVNI